MLMVQANINGTAVQETFPRLSSVYECVQHSKATSAQWYASRSFSHPLARFPTILFYSLHPSVYTGLGFSQSYLFNPPPSKSSKLTKPSLIAAQRQLCTSLSQACFPCLTHVQFLHSLHVPPVLFQTAIMCLGVAQHGAEFHSSNHHQVLAGAKIKWGQLKSLIWQSLTSSRASQTTFHTWERKTYRI